jgi:hypothetical protein
MIIIEIESTAVAQKSGSNAKGPWTMYFQQILITGHHVDGFPARHPRESTIQLDDKNPTPYPAGKYVIAPESYFFGDFGRFSLGRLKLQPVAAFFADLQKQTGARVTFEQAKAA